MTSPTQAHRIAAAQRQLQDIAGRLSAEVRALRTVTAELRAEPDPGPLPVLEYLAGHVAHLADEANQIAKFVMEDATEDIADEYRRGREEDAA